jgi:hypothetical protein
MNPILYRRLGRKAGGKFVTMTYLNPFGEIAPPTSAVQQVRIDLKTKPALATTTLSMAFQNWSDGSTKNPRKDTARKGGRTYTATFVAAPFYGDTSDSSAGDAAVGDSLDGIFTGTGWQGLGEIYNAQLRLAVDEDFETYTVGASVTGFAPTVYNNLEEVPVAALSRPNWSFTAASMQPFAFDNFNAYTIGQTLSGKTSPATDSWPGQVWVTN